MTSCLEQITASTLFPLIRRISCKSSHSKFIDLRITSCERGSSEILLRIIPLGKGKLLELSRLVSFAGVRTICLYESHWRNSLIKVGISGGLVHLENWVSVAINLTMVKSLKLTIIKISGHISNIDHILCAVIIRRIIVRVNL